MRYLLDTNMVSHILRQHPNVMARLQSVPMSALAISAITHAELHYGLAKRPQAVALQRAVHEFLLRVSVLPFDEAVATHYGTFKATFERQGKNLAPLDMMIAAHADAVGAVLVSDDRAFAHIPNLAVENWTETHQPKR